jgi:prephenate dehydrogenase
VRIGVIGLGLIGGSLAGAFIRGGHEVNGCDLNRDSERAALQRGHVSAVCSPADIHSMSDIAFLCVPLEETVRLIPSVAQAMKPAAILTDVASVKRPVIAAMDSVESGSRCIGGHPMTGKATGGIESADPDLFRGATYAIVPSVTTDDAVLNIILPLLRELGAQPVEIDAASHDAEVARTSHLPQVLSSALSLALDGARTDNLSGPGLAGMLRLAHSDERLWAEILIANRDDVGAALKQYSHVLDAFANAISSGDSERVLKLMRAAREALP